MTMTADPKSRVTAEDALLDVMHVVRRVARLNERYGVEADDIAQEALIRLYSAFCRDMPETATEREKLATTCTVRAALHLHRYATRQARDFHRTEGSESLECNAPILQPFDSVETEELIEHTPNPKAVRLRLAGYNWQEIGKKIGNEGRQWRYDIQESLSRTLAAV